MAMALIGGRAQGKSTYARKKIIEPCYDLRTDKILVLTPTVPPAYGDIREVTLHELQNRRWHGMLRYYNHQSAKQMLKDIHDLCTANKLRKGLLVFEDCTNYIDPWPAESIRNFLVNMRMFDLDLIFTTHAIRFLPKFCRTMVNTVTTFKTAENFRSPEELRQLGYANYEALYNGWKYVMEQPKVEGYIQAHRTIDTGI